jgi:NAD(P)H-flavin reductase
MQKVAARVTAIQRDQDGRTTAEIACPPEAIPGAGQYALAWAPADRDSPLATALFPARRKQRSFIAAPQVPDSWTPGTRLELRAPLGHGFSPPENCRRVALAAFDSSLQRLLPLIFQATSNQADVTVFTDTALPHIPSAVEVFPLSDLPTVLTWADYLALDLPRSAIPGLRARLGLAPGAAPNCPAQALVFTAMPCGGDAECGACALPYRRKWKLVCKDGPVFDLNDLDW